MSSTEDKQDTMMIQDAHKKKEEVMAKTPRVRRVVAVNVATSDAVTNVNGGEGGEGGDDLSSKKTLKKPKRDNDDGGSKKKMSQANRKKKTGGGVGANVDEMTTDDDDHHNHYDHSDKKNDVMTTAPAPAPTAPAPTTPEDVTRGGGDNEENVDDDDDHFNDDDNQSDQENREGDSMPSQAEFMSALKKGLRLNKKHKNGSETTATASPRIDCLYFGNTEPSSPQQITDFLANMAANGAVDMTNIAVFVNSAAAMCEGEHSFPAKLSGLELVHRFVVQRLPENQIPRHPRSKMVVPKDTNSAASDDCENDCAMPTTTTTENPQHKRKSPEDNDLEETTSAAVTTIEHDDDNSKQPQTKKTTRSHVGAVLGDANSLLNTFFVPYKDPLRRMFPRRENGHYGNIICNEIALYVSPNIAANSEAYVLIPKANNVIQVANKVTSTILEAIRHYWNATHYVAIIQKMPNMTPLETDGADTSPQRREFRGWTIISRDTQRNSITGVDMSRMEHTRGGHSGYARMYSIVRTMRPEECKSARQDFDLYAGTKGDEAAADAYKQSAWLQQHWPAPGSKPYLTMDLVTLRKQLANKGKLASRRTYVDESGKRVSKAIAKKRRAEAAVARVAAGGSGKKKMPGTGRPRFGGLMLVSDEMKKFIEDNGIELEGDRTRATRSQFTKAVNIYINKNNLRREGERTKIDLDDRLKNLLIVPEASLHNQTAFTIMRFMGHHYKKDPPIDHTISGDAPSTLTTTATATSTNTPNLSK